MVLDDPVMSDFMCSRPSSTGAGQSPPSAAAAASASSAPPSKPAAAASVPPLTTSSSGGRLGKKKVRDRLQHTELDIHE
eukprot:COSAG01_NODE_1696_length_9461_cov_8.289010_4_plen_79_part_00